jgi:hypothetical protein
VLKVPEESTSTDQRINMGFSKIHGTLTSRIGCRVRFGAPQDVSKAGGAPVYGTIVDEVWADPTINKSRPSLRKHKDDWGAYSFCGQLISWDDGSQTVRLAYYRRRAGENWWEFASQMTVNTDPRTVKRLLTKTLAKKNWFR